MSSHCVWVQCSVVGCDESGSIYTGDTYIDGFTHDQFEMETIHVPCDKHLNIDETTGAPDDHQ